MYKARVCYYFEATGTCQYGNRCKFQHIPQESLETSGSKQKYGSGYSGERGVCYSHRDTGHCRFGNSCRFDHGGGFNKSNSSSKSKQCWTFRDTGSCSYGDRCRFSHDEERPKPNISICYNYRDTGSCRFGDSCRYSHGDYGSHASGDSYDSDDSHASDDSRTGDWEEGGGVDVLDGHLMAQKLSRMALVEAMEQKSLISHTVSQKDVVEETWGNTQDCLFFDHPLAVQAHIMQFLNYRLIFRLLCVSKEFKDAGLERLKMVENARYMFQDINQRSANYLGRCCPNIRNLTCDSLATFSGLLHDRSKLESIECWEDIERGTLKRLSSVPFLKELHVFGGMDAESWIYVSKNCKELESILFRRYGSDYISTFGQHLSPNIKKILIERSQLSESDFLALQKSCKTLKTLEFGEKCDVYSGRGLSSWIRNCTTIEHLSIRPRYNYDGEICIDFSAIGCLSNLTNLYISGCTAESASELRKCKKLTNLDLSGVEGVSYGAALAILKNCCNLDHLFFSYGQENPFLKAFDDLQKPIKLKQIYT